MEELMLNNRRLKLIDGEVCVWKPIKNPYWRKVKYSITTEGYYRVRLTHNKIEECYYTHRVIYKFNNPDWDIHDSSNNNQVDHIDNNKGNNNIENLRIVNSSQNNQNKLSTKGYSWNKNSNKYQAYIKLNKKYYHLGCYDTAEEAREAYLIGKEKYHTY